MPVESIQDIVREMREHERGDAAHAFYSREDWRKLCDRIEAAMKRDPAPGPSSGTKSGNAAAMREALSDACYAMFNFLKTQSGGCEEMALALDKAKAALAAPARNCDRTFADHVAMYDEFKAWCNAKGHTMNPKLASDAFDWLLSKAEGAQ